MRNGGNRGGFVSRGHRRVGRCDNRRRCDWRGCGLRGPGSCGIWCRCLYRRFGNRAFDGSGYRWGRLPAGRGRGVTRCDTRRWDRGACWRLAALLSVRTGNGELSRGGTAGVTSCMSPVAPDMERFPEEPSVDSGMFVPFPGDTRTGFASILCPPVPSASRSSDSAPRGGPPPLPSG